MEGAVRRGALAASSRRARMGAGAAFPWSLGQKCSLRGGSVEIDLEIQSKINLQEAQTKELQGPVQTHQIQIVYPGKKAARNFS